MEFRVTAKFDDGRTVEVTAGPRDQLAWEKAGPSRALAHLMGELRITNLYSLAHVAMKRQGLFSGTLKEFEDAVDLEFGHASKGEESEEVDETDEDPTQSGPSEED